MARTLYRDRREAGQVLAQALDHYRGRAETVVLALPRGGVPVGYEVARLLELPLDVFLVRKLGAPGHRELAMGAIASGGTAVINEDVVRRLRISPRAIEEVTRAEGSELERRQEVYRKARPPVAVQGKTVILVDDGLATGATMRSAIRALRLQEPARLVMAVPVAPWETCRELQEEADEVICAATPAAFHAVGTAYQDFSQVTDEEVTDLLAATSRE